MIRTRALLVVVGLIVMTGCGGSSSNAPRAKDLSGLSATAILAKAKAQVDAHTDVSIEAAGSATDPAHKALKFSYSGNDSAGTVTTDSGVLTLLNVGGVVYYKADDAFWKYAAGNQATGIIAKLKGRWIKPAADSSFADFLTVADRSLLTTQILNPQGTISKGSTKKVNGVTCITLDDGAIGSLYVARNDARPIQIMSKTDGELNFSYDAVDIPDTPTAAEVVDESELGLTSSPT